MAKKTNSSEVLATTNAASGSPMGRRVKNRSTDPLTIATQPSDEVMNALFEEAAVGIVGLYRQ